MQYNTMEPSGVRAMTLMRLRVELNSRMFRISNRFVEVDVPSDEGSSTSIAEVCLALKKNPNRFAATTNADSSGLSAW